MVNEERQVNLKKGKNIVLYKNISQKLIMESVILYSQSYSYDTVNLNSMLKQYLGKKIFYKEDGVKNEGILLSKSPIMIKTERDIITLKEKSQIIFPEIPENMTIKPSLIWEISSKEKIKSKINLNYLTTGLSWKSDYVINLNEKKLDLNSWITVNNYSGVTYKNVNLSFLSREINREKRVTNIKNRRYKNHTAAAISNDIIEFKEIKEESFAGYHIYKLPFKATIKNKTKQQFTFLNKKISYIRVTEEAY